MNKKIKLAFLWDWGGVVSQQVVVFIISIFLARLLTPEDFGLVGMSMVVISFSTVFIDAGFGSALVQSQKNTDDTYNSVFFANIVLGLLLTLITFWVAPYVGDFYNNPKISELIRWLSLIFLFNSFNVVQVAILEKKLEFRTLTIRLIISTIIGGVLGIIAAFNGLGVYSLLVQSISRALIGSILIWSLSEWRPRLSFSLTELNKVKNFSFFVFLDHFLLAATNHLDVLVIGKVFSPSILGYYSRAVTLKDQVSKLTATSVSKVYYPVLSSLQLDPKGYKKTYFELISIVSFVASIISIGLLTLGEPLIILLFGEKWRPSVDIFELLILTAFAFPINAIIIKAYLSFGLAKKHFILGIFRKLVRLTPLVFASIYGLKVFLVAFVISIYFLTLFNIISISRDSYLSLKDHLKQIGNQAFPYLVSVLGYFFLVADNNSIVGRLIYLIAVLILFYLWAKITNNVGLSLISKKIRDLVASSKRY